MKQSCLTCRREAPAGSLWCQEAHCATDDKPPILETGEHLADMEIVRNVVILAGSALYRAERDAEPILLKVAHPGHEARLQREAAILAQLAWGKGGHPALPRLLPAYQQSDVQQFPFGRVAAGGRTFPYAVFAYVPGEPLSDLLLQEPQPWYQHAGWLTLAVADAVAWLHQRERLHLTLSPDMILIRKDRDGIPRPLLVDLGVAAAPGEAVAAWQPALANPAYSAPELLAGSNGRPRPENAGVGAGADIYGLGLILYEMLGGQPAYANRQLASEAVRQAVLTTEPPPLERPDLRRLPEVAQQAISKEPRRRQPHVVAFARELQATLPAVPKERLPRTINWQLIGIVLATAMAIALLLVLAIALAG